MSTSISADVGNLPCFPTFFYDPTYVIYLKFLIFSLYLFVYFCTIILTGEPIN